MPTLKSNLTAQITVRVNNRHAHRLTVAMAVANARQHLVRFELCTLTQMSSCSIIGYHIIAQRRVRYSSREAFRLIHFIMDSAVCPLDWISWVLLK